MRKKRFYTFYGTQDSYYLKVLGPVKR